jgi:hypothetical protein
MCYIKDQHPDAQGYCIPQGPTPYPSVSPCKLHSLGDANCDEKINTDDFNIWRDEFLASVVPTKTGSKIIPDAHAQRPARSDFNSDGRVNTDDFNIWRDGFLKFNSAFTTPSACPTPPICQPGQTLIHGDPEPDSGVTCPSYACLGVTTCGNGVCENVACESLNCPIPENSTNCPQDCSNSTICNVQPDANGNCPEGCVNYGVPLGCITQEYAQYCQTNACPICLSENTKILTPNGEKSIQSLSEGDVVYSTDVNGKKIVSRLLKVSKTFVGNKHKILTIELQDGRSLNVSPGHPTADGQDIALIKKGDNLDGSKVVKTELTNYNYEYTYDLLPDSTTGNYYANGILMGSTLKD